jgi:hypothetical protein
MAYFGVLILYSEELWLSMMCENPKDLVLEKLGGVELGNLRSWILRDHWVRTHVFSTTKMRTPL